MLQTIYKPLQERGLRQDTINIISASWRTSTKKQYSSYIKRWINFCQEKGTNHLVADVNCVLEFLGDLFNKEQLSYSAINTARSALSSFLVLTDATFTVGNHPLISRLLKGSFHLRPPKPRYDATWDVNIVFNYLRKMSPVTRLSLKQLTLKVCMLLALTSAQRVQSLSYLHLDLMQILNNSVTFQFLDLLKQSKPGNTNSSLKIQGYPPDRRLCVLRYLRQYIERTRDIRGTERYLFISFKKPHGRVTTSTIARWIKEVMKAAGIDTEQYKAHSTRAASTSAACQNNLPVSDILKQAGWSNEKTFRTFYKKPIEAKNFQTSVIMH